MNIQLVSKARHSMTLRTGTARKGHGTFQEALRFLHSWGIEPSITTAREMAAFSFCIPKAWDRERKQAFVETMNQHCKRNHSCTGCGSDEETAFHPCPCGSEIFLCRECGTEPVEDCLQCLAIENWTLELPHCEPRPD